MKASWSTVGILALLAAAVLSAGCGGAGEPEARAVTDDEPLGVLTAVTEAGLWSDGFEVTAGIQPWRRALPGTVLMGRIETIVKREGDRVRSGEVLARIESRDVSARLAQAEAGLEAARAGEENARVMRERLERLFPRQAATKKSLDDAVAAHEAALARLRAAEEEIAAARVALSYTEVRAPFDGVISERRVEAGDMGAPGMPFFVVDQVERLKIEAAVPESRIGQLTAGEPVEVVVTALPEASRKGTLEEILPAADPASRTFTVRVVVDNRDGKLRPGMFARLRLGGGQREVVAVPESALWRRGPLTGVYVVDGSDRARLRWVTVGESRDGVVEILTGLDAGARYVVEAGEALADGRAVREL